MMCDGLLGPTAVPEYDALLAQVMDFGFSATDARAALSSKVV